MRYDWTLDGQTEEIKQCHSLNHFCFCFEQVGGWKLPEWMSYGSHHLLSWWRTALTSFKAVEDTVLSSRAHMEPAELRTRHTLTKDMAKSTKCFTDDTTLAECVGLWPHAARNSTIISTKSATSSVWCLWHQWQWENLLLSMEMYRGGQHASFSQFFLMTPAEARRDGALPHKPAHSYNQQGPPVYGNVLHLLLRITFTKKWRCSEKVVHFFKNITVPLRSCSEL